MPGGEALWAPGQGRETKLPGCTHFLNQLTLGNLIFLSAPQLLFLFLFFLKKGIIIWPGG